VLGILKFRDLALASRLIFLLISYVFLKEVAAILIARLTSYNLSFYKFLSPVDFLITLSIFVFIPAMRGLRGLLFITGLLVVCFYFINLIYLQPPGFGIDSNFKMVRSAFLVFLSLILFYRLMANPDEETVFRKSAFWFCSALILFYVFNIFYWGVFNYGLARKVNYTSKLVLFFEVSNYILYSFLTISMFVNNFRYNQVYDARSRD